MPGQMEVDSADERLQAFLDDRIQTAADLASVGSLLEDVQRQHELLQGQLAEVRITLEEAQKQSRLQQSQLRQRIDGFCKTQIDIDRRAAIVTRSEASEDAVARLEPKEGQLRRLNIAHAYLDLLGRAGQLRFVQEPLISTSDDRDQARTKSKESLTEALRAQRQLRVLADDLQHTHTAVEHGAPHLVHAVAALTFDAWQDIKVVYTARFEQTLKEFGWPQLSRPISTAMQSQWRLDIEALLRIQEFDIAQTVASKSADPPVLLPLEVLVKPLEMRFAYHFEGDRPTNKLDRPDYFLAHLRGLIDQYEEFLFTHLQPPLLAFFRTQGLPLHSNYVSSTSVFITALLPMVRRKLQKIMPEVAQKPGLLSHFMHEVVAFDANLRDIWSFEGHGLAHSVLVTWFGQWLAVEKDFALTRYGAIIDAPDAFEIDYDSVETAITKPTLAAIRVHDLLETITECYRSLASFPQKLQFLMDIQISIFDLFHARLSDSLAAYQTMTSTLGRNIQGASQADKSAVAGTKGLERLCRVFGSADFLERKMRDWGDDGFFLELWEELQERAHKHVGGTLAGSMTMSHVAERTSASIQSLETEGGALFDETAGAYRKLRARAQTLLQERLTRQAREALKPYGRINPWTTGSSAPTVELSALLSFLQESLDLLSRVLSPVALQRISWDLCDGIQTFLWDSVLMRYKFTAEGSLRLQRDVSAITDVVNGLVGAGHAEAGLPRLNAALQLLNLSQADEDGLDAWDADAQEPDRPSWSSLERRVFRNDTEAQAALSELDIRSLSARDARSVFERKLS